MRIMDQLDAAYRARDAAAGVWAKNYWTIVIEALLRKRDEIDRQELTRHPLGWRASSLTAVFEHRLTRSEETKL